MAWGTRVKVRKLWGLADVLERKIPRNHWLNNQKNDEKIEVEEKANVGDLVSKLIGLYGSSFKEIIFPQRSDNVGAYIAIAVKGTEFCLLNGLDSPLNDGDTIMMATIVMGG